MAENRVFESGAVRSGDADHMRLDLVSPIGANVYALWQAMRLDDSSKMYGLWMSIVHIYGFLKHPGKHGVDPLSRALEYLDDSVDARQGIQGHVLLLAGAAAHEGAVKYAPHNWEAGMPVHDLLNHAIRHIILAIQGDDTEDHVGHAAWNILSAIHSYVCWPHLNEGHLRNDDGTPPTAPPGGGGNG